MCDTIAISIRSFRIISRPYLQKTATGRWKKFDENSLWWQMEWAGQLTGMDEDVYFEINSNVLSDIVLEQGDAQERTGKNRKAGEKTYRKKENAPRPGNSLMRLRKTMHCM